MTTMFDRIRSSMGSRKSRGDGSNTLVKPQVDSYPQRNPPPTRRPRSSPSPKPKEPKPNNPPETNPPQPTNDAPPAYTPAPQPTTSTPRTTHTPTNIPTNTGADDPYTFLSTFDTIFLIDDSGSMAGSRWRQTADALETITPICTAHDSDGIDIYFLNHSDSAFHHNVTSASTVREIFSTVRPGGGTPTGQRLMQILRPYLRRLEGDLEGTKPINIICVTDGEPSDDVESPLIYAAKKLDKLDAAAWQIGVQFFQVGRDEEAKKHLQLLDDELAEIAGDGELRDIVDTVHFTGAEGTSLTGDGILKVVLGAVNRRLDRKKSQDLHR